MNNLKTAGPNKILMLILSSLNNLLPGNHIIFQESDSTQNILSFGLGCSYPLNCYLVLVHGLQNQVFIISFRANETDL